jgi:rod shape-determining protein MreC
LGDYQQFKLTDGRVVGKSTESDSLIISLGSNDGLKKGMPVITSSKELIGKVYNVLPDFAHVQLITNKEVSFGAKVEGKDDSLGILKNDDGLSLEMIEREVDLEKGDKIITHPEDGIYPEGILIGEIREVVKDDASAFQSVLVNPAFNPKDIAYLFVITDF